MYYSAQKSRQFYERPYLPTEDEFFLLSSKYRIELAICDFLILQISEAVIQ